MTSDEKMEAAPGRGAGAEAAAVSLAASLARAAANDDPAVAARAASFLDDQSRLIKLEIERLEEERSPSSKSSGSSYGARP